MRHLVPITSDSAVVLLVQPYDDGLKMYVEFLRYHGLAVIGVSDPWDALTAAPKAHVIVTGILLAGSMDGVELIARLRRDERTHQPPIIALTACAWKTERERAEHAGCDMFVPKPCLPDELLRHVHQWLPESRLRDVRPPPIKGHSLNQSGACRGITGETTRQGRPS
jgi:CheY-like chemotaxis protein